MHKRSNIWNYTFSKTSPKCSLSSGWSSNRLRVREELYGTLGSDWLLGFKTRAHLNLHLSLMIVSSIWIINEACCIYLLEVLEVRLAGPLRPVGGQRPAGPLGSVGGQRPGPVLRSRGPVRPAQRCREPEVNSLLCFESSWRITSFLRYIYYVLLEKIRRK